MPKVQAYVYDITQGMAKMMSPGLVGKQIDYVPHTGIVVFGKEYFFGGGPCIGVPGQTVGVPVYKTLDLGETSKTAEELEAYINATLASEHNEANYSLLHHNCNHYADDVAKFLLDGKGIPSEIVDIAKEALDTPQGQQMKAMIENMEKGMRTQAGGASGLNPFANANGSGPAAPVMPAAMPAMPAAPAVGTTTAANVELQAALADVAGVEKEAQRMCLSTLTKVTENIANNPEEAKFRKIKMSNAAFEKKVVCCNGGTEAMLACGWQPEVEPDNGEDVWLLGDQYARNQGGNLKMFKAALEKLGPAPGAAAPKAAAPARPMFGTDAAPPGQGYGAQAAGGMPGGLPGMGGMPGMGGGAGMPDMQAMMNNPAAMQQAQAMGVNPQQMQQAMQAMQNNPQMAAQVQQMMQDPNAMANIQNMMAGRGRGM